MIKMDSKVEKLIIALLENNTVMVEKLIVHFKDTQSGNDFDALTSNDQRIRVLKKQAERFMSVACQNGNEEIIRILEANKFCFKFSDIERIYNSGPKNFHIFMERNPTWFSSWRPDFQYGALNGDSDSREERTAYFAEFILSDLDPTLPFTYSTSSLVKRWFIESLDMELFSKRIAGSQKKISRRMYNTIVFLKDDMEDKDEDQRKNNITEVWKIVESKYQTQYLKPMEMKIDKISSKDKSTLEYLEGRVSILTKELEHVTLLLSKISKPQPEEQQKLFFLNKK